MRHLYKLWIAFFVVTLFFLIQHYFYLGWDFAVFVLNGEYWFSNGIFFEATRAPLVPFILGVLGIVFGRFAEYIYIVLVSLLFLYSSVKLAEALKFNKEWFYILSLNAAVLCLGLFEGSELLSFALLELFVASLILNKNSGLFLGLACLVRYTNGIFLVLLLFHKKVRKILWNCFLFTLPFIPWFLYNWIKYGNPLTSIVDSLALNMFYRYYIVSTFSWSNLLLSLNYLIPFILIGLFYYFYKKKYLKRKGFVMLAVTLLTVYSVYSIKANVLRYMFPLFIPGFYFAYLGLRKYKEYILVSFLVFALIFSCFYGLEFSREKWQEYVEKGAELGCGVKSNIWPILNYYGVVAESAPKEELVEYYIDEGYYILLAYSAREPTYTLDSEFLHQFPVYFEDSRMIILGSGCAEINTVDKLYLDELNESIYLIHNYTIETDPYQVLLDKFIS